jgi:NAD(P)-dependent dehydrogenase (short-subunit alcohol dehydrogenase family)
MTSPIQRTALITGASRGLGLALARELAGRGWSLILDARGAEALEAARAELARRTDVIAIAGDVADESHRQALAAAARSVGGRPRGPAPVAGAARQSAPPPPAGLDAVVNNAGILGPSPQPLLLAYPLDVLEQVYRTNVVAPLAVVQAVRETLKPGARVINITSDAGVEAYPGWGGYGSSKAALEQLSAVLAAEAPSLRVYWVDPGDMRTQMHQEAFPGEDISDRPLPDESIPGLIELLEGDLPSGRYVARSLTPAARREEALVD